jgi:alkanesulfonate monooxygenase SsuD/methylene tetrahydromethanopterin reductase-like flavin-dependent oxidoreductase (luciferase family)
MRFGLKTNQNGLTWAELSSRARYAEDHGFDGVWLFDHLAARDDEGPVACMESWTLLAALAATTSRVRLGVMMTGVMFRHPSLLAAEAVTVDQVSGGRLEIGIGAASAADEHREMGFDFPAAADRSERLEEAVSIVRLLMSGERIDVDGAHYRLDGATYRPLPAQRPHPPIWIGAGGERYTLPVAARVADVWHAFDAIEDLPRKIRVLDTEAEKVGRDPASIERATTVPISGPTGDVPGRIDALRDLGFGYVVIPWPEEGRSRLDAFVRDVM